MVLTTLADGVTRSVETLTGSVSGLFFEPTVRLGVAGLSRAGKTVFITSLVANLLDRGRMPQLLAASNGAIRTAYLQPQPDDTIPRFDYEAHMAAMLGTPPHWPEGTRNVSELRVSLRLQPGGLLGTISGPTTVHLDIVDYPGEWLLDLGLLDKSYETWSRETLDKLSGRPQGGAYLERLSSVDPSAKLDEVEAKGLADAFAHALRASQEAGYANCTPGRFLLPGELEGSPVLTFAPLPSASAGLGREFKRRYEAYKARVVKPFFRDHFARIDRQIVLVDVLGAMHQGPRAVSELETAMTDILAAFRPGRNAFLTQLFMGRRVDKILFAATKADHLHHAQHDALVHLTEALLKSAKARAEFSGADVSAMALAAWRSTTEAEIPHAGATLNAVRGVAAETGKRVAFHPGTLPEDPGQVLRAAQAGHEAWGFGDIQSHRFAPPEITLKPGDGPPHIRLDRAAEFLFGDKLR